MGTNFYLLKHGHDDNPGYHLGKRSAAGLYCWDCNLTLCKLGELRIHYSDSDKEWFNECPKCHKKPVKESLDNNSAGRELGFNKQFPDRKKGVASCASFIWAMSREDYSKIPLNRKKVIMDEYDRKYTKKQFLDVLLECPIQYFHNVGNEFC